jgi:hypothetical protein
LATRQARRQEMSKNLAQCSNEDRQDVHDAHGQERDSDHCQPRKNELIHVLGRAVFASLWQEHSRATGQVAVRTFDLPGPFILETRCGNRASALRNRSSSFRRVGCYPSPHLA